MSRAKQSKADRTRRFSEGCCPVHGQEMSQVEGWCYEEGRRHMIVGCCRKDCQIKAKAYGIDGPWELLPEWKSLLD